MSSGDFGQSGARWAMVTGASAGIGRSTAHELARRGCSLLLLARREKELGEAVQECLRLGAPLARALACDLSSADSWQKAIAQVPNEISTIEILVNSAGLAAGVDPVAKANESDWQRMIDINVTALFRATRAVLPAMMSQRRGHIINLGSVAGRWSYPGGAVYCATKAAVRAFTEGLRLDAMGSGIRVTNIVPGMVNTEFSFVRMGDRAKADAVYMGMTPLSAEDVARTIAWCIDQPPHVNVQELVLFPTDQAGVGYVHRSAAVHQSVTPR